MKWSIVSSFPCLQVYAVRDSLSEVIQYAEGMTNPKYGILIESASFGVGGCHRLVHEPSKGWINPRTGMTAEQEGWL